MRVMGSKVKGLTIRCCWVLKGKGVVIMSEVIFFCKFIIFFLSINYVM